MATACLVLSFSQCLQFVDGRQYESNSNNNNNRAQLYDSLSPKAVKDDGGGDDGPLYDMIKNALSEASSHTSIVDDQDEINSIREEAYSSSLFEEEDSETEDPFSLALTHPKDKKKTNDNEPLGFLSSPHWEIFDSHARRVSLWLTIPLLWQTIATLLSHENVLFHQIAGRVLSPETVKAVRNVRTILQRFSDRGALNVFRDYPIRDVIFSIVALAKLQRAAAVYQERRDQDVQYRNGGRPSISRESMGNLAHYAVYAHAAYGWKFDLAFKGLFRLGNLQTLIHSTKIRPRDVVVTNWSSETLRPAYFIARDHEKKSIVLCVRGTLSGRDILTDLCCEAESFSVDSDNSNKKRRKKRQHRGRAHQGMVHAAQALGEETKDVIAQELTEYPDYGLVIVGHSLGGGVAAVLSTLWQSDFESKVYIYGPPCVGPLDSLPTNGYNNIVSVVSEGDPFSCLSLGHVIDTSTAIEYLCQNAELRSEIFRHGTAEELSESDLAWCAQQMEQLRRKLEAEKLYPPGRILCLKQFPDVEGGGRRRRRSDSSVALEEVPRSNFFDLRLHPRMLDFTKHVPSSYESLLGRVLKEEYEEKEA